MSNQQGQIIVGNFGIQDGVQIYRVNGLKDDLLRLIDECIEMGAEFDDAPELEFVHARQYSVLLKIKVAVPVGKEA